MRRFKPWSLQWAARLLFFAGTLSAWAAATGVTTALLEHEPAAVRQLMQQADDFESAPDTPDNEWQAAVLLRNWGHRPNSLRSNKGAA